MQMVYEEDHYCCWQQKRVLGKGTDIIVLGNNSKVWGGHLDKVSKWPFEKYITQQCTLRVH